MYMYNMIQEHVSQRKYQQSFSIEIKTNKMKILFIEINSMNIINNINNNKISIANSSNIN